MTPHIGHTKGALLVFDIGSADRSDGGHGEGPGVFALEVLDVAQVIEPEVISPVPLAPACVIGILNHHGRIVTVVEPSEALGVGPQGAPVAHVVILRQRRTGLANLGFQVLRIRGILPGVDLMEVDVTAGPCVKWVGERERRLIHVLELESFVERLSHQFGPAEAESGQGVGL